MSSFPLLHLCFLYLICLLPTVTRLAGPTTSSALQTAGWEDPGVKVKPDAGEKCKWCHSKQCCNNASHCSEGLPQPQVAGKHDRVSPQWHLVWCWGWSLLQQRVRKVFDFLISACAYQIFGWMYFYINIIIIININVFVWKCHVHKFKYIVSLFNFSWFPNLSYWEDVMANQPSLVL